MHSASDPVPVNPAELSELAALIRGGASLLVIESHDEPHAVNLFRELRSLIQRPLLVWTAASGLERIGHREPMAASLRDAEKALVHLLRREDRPMALLLDFHPFMDDPLIIRLMREAARGGAEGCGPTLVLVSAELSLPTELSALARRFELYPPDRSTLVAMVRSEAGRWGRQRSAGPAEVDDRALDMLVNNLSGLTMKDARRLTRNAIFDDGVLNRSDLDAVMRAKFELLDPDGCLNFELETARFADVAGMPNLKRWLELRAEVFAAPEPPSGLTPPRGVLLMGVQGCGKSLAARAAAGLFRVPLLHLDFGALFDRYHGQSERNLRNSLRAAELMAPCVMWLDEIEKGLATSDSDGGTSRRMLGTFLTWLAEHRSRVFVAATANDITALPPELMRKGRFDEIFFVDLPDAATRQDILAIHLRRRELKSELFPLDRLAAATRGFSGAELEHLIVSGLYAAHADNQALTTDHLLAEISRTRPLSVVRSESIAQLRQWAADRAVMA